MNSEEVRKKRLEEIELKKKRLEEMRKSRQNQSQSQEPQNQSLNQNQTPNQANEVSPILTEVLKKQDESVLSPLSTGIVVKDTKDGASKASKARYFSYYRSPETAILIQSKEKVLYNKETQTDDLEEQESEDPFPNTKEHPAIPLVNEPPKLIREKSISSTSDHSSATFPEKSQKLSESEISLYFGKPEFKEFMEVSSLRIEREMEYLRQFNNLKELSNKRQGHATSSATLCSVSQSFEEELLRYRAICSISSNPNNPSIFLTCHLPRDHHSHPPHQPSIVTPSQDLAEETQSGLVCVWSKDLHQRPEVRLSSSSIVHVAIFSLEEAETVIGGCENGQIVIWDLSSAKHSPLKKSSVTAKGHKYPVKALSCTGLNTLFSMSVDGMVCQWDLSRLVEPVFLVLVAPGPGLGPELGAASDPSFLFSPQSDKGSSSALHYSCMSCLSVEAKVLCFIGTGTGLLFRIQFPRKSNEPLVQVQAHAGLITSLAVQDSERGLRSKTRLLLTASLDWTVKLWDSSDISKPLMEFFNPLYEYICDVQWSPTNPALFITITSSGSLSLWNLAKTITEPSENIHLLHDLDEAAKNAKISPLVSTNGSIIALNKALWIPDGQSILVGDSLGVVRAISFASSGLNLSSVDESKLHNLFRERENSDQQSSSNSQG